MGVFKANPRLHDRRGMSKIRELSLLLAVFIFSFDACGSAILSKLSALSLEGKEICDTQRIFHVPNLLQRVQILFLCFFHLFIFTCQGIGA